MRRTIFLANDLRPVVPRRREVVRRLEVPQDVQEPIALSSRATVRVRGGGNSSSSTPWSQTAGPPPRGRARLDVLAADGGVGHRRRLDAALELAVPVLHVRLHGRVEGLQEPRLALPNVSGKGAPGPGSEGPSETTLPGCTTCCSRSVARRRRHAAERALAALRAVAQLVRSRAIQAALRAGRRRGRSPPPRRSAEPRRSHRRSERHHRERRVVEGRGAVRGDASGRFRARRALSGRAGLRHRPRASSVAEMRALECGVDSVFSTRSSCSVWRAA